MIVRPFNISENSHASISRKGVNVPPPKKTSASAWKQRERDMAALFGAKRARCSGSSGREDCSRSDSTHYSLFIETKLQGGPNATRTLLDATRQLATKEGKAAVLGIASKARQGFMLVVHSDDFEAIVAEYVAANASDELEGKIRRAFERINGALDVAQAAEASPRITPILPSDAAIDEMAGIILANATGERIEAKCDEIKETGLAQWGYRDPAEVRAGAEMPPAAIPWPPPPDTPTQRQKIVDRPGGGSMLVGRLDGLPAHWRACCGGTSPKCCDRSGEYNGFGSDGPPAFLCPNGCPCHD